jgi:hypothetical protein
MEEKWNAYLDGNRLSWHRSWTGHGIFEIEVERSVHGYRPVRAWVESDRGRYRRGTAEAEGAHLEMLIDTHFAKADRPDLRDRYQRLRFGT